MGQREFYTVADLAAKTGLSESTILGWTRSRDPRVCLRSYKPGGERSGKILVKVPDWDTYLEQHVTVPTGEGGEAE